MATVSNDKIDAPKLNAEDAYIQADDIEEIPSPQPLADLSYISGKREDTRGKLAIYFVVGFFSILVLGMIIAAFNGGDKVASIKETLLVISGILSGPLGFVIGYYFRSKDQD